jgi:hypothetical protein
MLQLIAVWVTKPELVGDEHATSQRLFAASLRSLATSPEVRRNECKSFAFRASPERPSNAPSNVPSLNQAETASSPG